MASVMRRSRGVLAALACVVIAAGCSGSDSSDGSDAGVSKGKAGSPARPAATVDVAPADSSAGVSPATPVVVTATDGTLTRVRVTDAAGKEVAGQLDDTGATWRSTGQLGFGATYRVSAVAKNADDKETTATSTFSTARAQGLAYDAMAPLNGQVVGVGMPIRIWFHDDASDKAVAVENKDEVLKHLKVTVSPPQEGAFHWFANDTELHWRPKEYWQAGTKVTVDVNLYGVDLGDGMFFKRSRQVSFTVGRKHVSVADTRTHHMKVYDGDRLVQDFPVSMGRAEGNFHTASGTYVVITKDRFKTMDSTTYGLALDAGGYVTKVEYATRISNSGTFVHSAPWSVADQGRRNVSHGCINVSPQRAAWFFAFSQPGDVVQVVGSPVKFTEKNGDIYDWTIPWEQWNQPS